MSNKSNIFGDLPKKPIKQTIEDNRLVERVESENLYPFKRGSFETYEDFKKRLIKSFQDNVSIGRVILDDENYDIDSKRFFLKIQYSKWVQQVSGLEVNSRFYIYIEPSEAKTLYYDYESYELVCQFKLSSQYGIYININEKIKTLILKMWIVAKANNIINHKELKILVRDLREQKSISSMTLQENTLCNYISYIEKKKIEQANQKQFRKRSREYQRIRNLNKKEKKLWENALYENTKESYEEYLEYTELCIYYKEAFNKYNNFCVRNEIINYFLTTIFFILVLTLGFWFPRLAELIRPINSFNYFMISLTFGIFGIYQAFKMLLEPENFIKQCSYEEKSKYEEKLKVLR